MRFYSVIVFFCISANSALQSSYFKVEELEEDSGDEIEQESDEEEVNDLCIFFDVAPHVEYFS